MAGNALSTRTRQQIEDRLPAGEQILVAEEVKRVSTKNERMFTVLGLLGGLIGAAVAASATRWAEERDLAGSVAHRFRLDSAYLVITDHSIHAIKRGFLGSLGADIARVPTSWIRSLETGAPKNVTLHFSDGSSRSVKLSNKRVLPYLNSLRPWIESTHRAALQPTAAPTRTRTMAEAW